MMVFKSMGTRAMEVYCVVTIKEGTDEEIMRIINGFTAEGCQLRFVDQGKLYFSRLMEVEKAPTCKQCLFFVYPHQCVANDFSVSLESRICEKFEQSEKFSG